jgi:hypothetical protein
VFRGEPIPLRDIARDVSLPVPVVAAVRGELQSRKLLDRGAGVVLTEAGREFVLNGLGLKNRHRYRPLELDELPEVVQDLLGPMQHFCEGRPRVDVTLDQSHATAQTALRRALYLLEIDALEGRDLLIVGDDDLASLAVALVVDRLDLAVRSLAVVEWDVRLVDYLSEALAAFPLQVDVRHHDLREPLPLDMQRGFDSFLTDPPYTIEGLSLFVSRGVSAMRPGTCRPAVVCFGQRAPDDAAEGMRRLTGMGLAPVEIIPGYNHYVGAQVLAGRSQLIRLMTTNQTSPEISERYTGKLYTADMRTAPRNRGRR